MGGIQCSEFMATGSASRLLEETHLACVVTLAAVVHRRKQSRYHSVGVTR